MKILIVFSLCIAISGHYLFAQQTQKMDDAYVEFASTTYIKRCGTGNLTTRVTVPICLPVGSGVCVILNVYPPLSIEKHDGINFSKMYGTDTLHFKHTPLLDPLGLPDIDFSVYGLANNSWAAFDFSQSEDDIVDDIIAYIHEKNLSYIPTPPDLQMFSTVVQNKKIQLASESYLNSLYNENDIFFVRDEFAKLITKKHSLIAGAATIPIKIRFKVPGGPSTAELNFPINGFLGYKYTEVHYRENDQTEFSLTPGIFLGISAPTLDETTNKTKEKSKYLIPAFNYGIAYQMGYRSIFIGVAVGADLALSQKGRSEWLYNNRPYVGVAFGYKLPIFK